MFRIPSQVDPSEERRKIKEGVKGNIVTFLVLCAAIRLTPIVLQKIGVD